MDPNGAAGALVGFNVFPALQGSGIGQQTRVPYRQSAERISLNLGGNTDDRFALSICRRCLGLFLCAEHGTNLTGESPVTGIYRQV